MFLPLVDGKAPLSNIAFPSVIERDAPSLAFDLFTVLDAPTLLFEDGWELAVLILFLLDSIVVESVPNVG